MRNWARLQADHAAPVGSECVGVVPEKDEEDEDVLQGGDEGQAAPDADHEDELELGILAAAVRLWERLGAEGKWGREEG